MNAPRPADRFLDAARQAADAAHPGDVTALLTRFGCAGLFARLGVDPPVTVDRAAHRLHQLFDVLLLERAGEIGEALDAAGVEHFFAKGVALLARVYRPGDRVTSDVDLYVPPAQRRAALERLGALGYAPWAERDQSGPPALRSSLALGRGGTGDLEHATVDLHWALDPVDRLLPRSDHPIPRRLWRAVGREGALRAPAPEHHAALLVRHLVHADFLPVRNVLDVAYLFGTMPADAGVEYLAAASELGVRGPARAVARLLAREFDIDRPAARGTGPMRPRFLARLSLEGLIAAAARANPEDNASITVRRIRRRIATLGATAVPRILADVFFPPPAFLAWRWPDRRAGAARARHYGQVVRKMLRSG